MSYRTLPSDDDAFRQWMRDVIAAIDALQRQQPVFGNAIRIGDLELRAVTVGTSVHLYATNLLTGAVVLIV